MNLLTSPTHPVKLEDHDKPFYIKIAINSTHFHLHDLILLLKSDLGNRIQLIFIAQRHLKTRSLELEIID